MLATHEKRVDGELCTDVRGMLETKAFQVAQEINHDPKLLPSFFHHAKLAL